MRTKKVFPTSSEDIVKARRAMHLPSSGATVDLMTEAKRKTVKKANDRANDAANAKNVRGRKERRNTTDEQRQKTLFAAAFRKVTGVSLAPEDIEIRGRQNPVMCCWYCKQKITAPNPNHVLWCREIYKALHPKKLWDLYKLGKVDIEERKTAKGRKTAYCVMCGQRVGKTPHFRAGENGVIECPAVEAEAKKCQDQLNEQTRIQDQYEQMLRNGKTVYVLRQPFR